MGVTLKLKILWFILLRANDEQQGLEKSGNRLITLVKLNYSIAFTSGNVYVTNKGFFCVSENLWELWGYDKILKYI